MIKVSLKNGVVKEYPKNTSIANIAKDLGAGLFKAACACIIDGKVADLRTELTKDSSVSILTFDDNEGKKVFWHTAYHILANAVKNI